MFRSKHSHGGSLFTNEGQKNLPLDGFYSSAIHAKSCSWRQRLGRKGSVHNWFFLFFKSMIVRRIKKKSSYKSFSFLNQQVVDHESTEKMLWGWFKMKTFFLFFYPTYFVWGPQKRKWHTHFKSDFITSLNVSIFFNFFFLSISFSFLSLQQLHSAVFHSEEQGFPFQLVLSNIYIHTYFENILSFEIITEV